MHSHLFVPVPLYSFTSPTVCIPPFLGDLGLSGMCSIYFVRHMFDVPFAFSSVELRLYFVSKSICSYNCTFCSSYSVGILSGFLVGLVIIV